MSSSLELLERARRRRALLLRRSRERERERERLLRRLCRLRSRDLTRAQRGIHNSGEVLEQWHGSGYLKSPHCSCFYLPAVPRLWQSLGLITEVHIGHRYCSARLPWQARALIQEQEHRVHAVSSQVP